jgi:hypothetical protein
MRKSAKGPNRARARLLTPRHYCGPVGFRRPREDAAFSRRWRSFTSTYVSLFDSARLPGLLRHDRHQFNLFLMHGYVDDGSGFSTDEMDAQQWAALDRLVAAYVAEFYDPGVALGPRPD